MGCCCCCCWYRSYYGLSSKCKSDAVVRGSCLWCVERLWCWSWSNIPYERYLTSKCTAKKPCMLTHFLIGPFTVRLYQRTRGSVGIDAHIGSTYKRVVSLARRYGMTCFFFKTHTRERNSRGRAGAPSRQKRKKSTHSCRHCCMCPPRWR
jgi:hypothetical protein